MTVRTTAFKEESKPKAAPKRTRRAKPKVTKQVTEQVTEQPKPKGRPPKDASIEDVIILYKEAITKLQQVKRIGKVSGSIASRCMRDTGRIINVLEKRR